MENNQYPKIALTFSGGGYRATSYDLGVLSYLHHLQIEEKSLLDCVQVLSTTSGGTITGARYAWGIKTGETFDQIYYALYYLMGKENLAEMGTSRLTTPSRSEIPLQSYIKAYADVYNKNVFEQGTFGAFFSEAHESHLKYLSFNATEFTHAMQFRFEYIEGITGIHANPYYHIPEAVSEVIQMGDIVAASTCFPGAYEPLNFPDDFALPEEVAEEVEELKRIKVYPDKSPYPVGLMDGGIVDNQGIEPVLDAEKHFRKILNRKHNEPNVLDLIMISDVSSNEVDHAYTAFEAQKLSWWQKLTFKQIVYVINSIALFFTIIPLIDNFQFDVTDDQLNEFFPLGLVAIFVGIQLFVERKIHLFGRKLEIPNKLREPLNNFLNMKIYVFQDMLINRLNSLVMMTNEVFIKHISNLNYRLVYDDDSWKNRRIRNAIYDLEPDELIQQSDEIPKNLRQEMPNRKVQEVIRQANTMESVLFFTEEQLSTENKDSLLDAMIASGQITTCWNLLIYLEQIKENPINTNEAHHTLLGCYDSILQDWHKFQQNPYWLVEQENQNAEVHLPKTIF